MLKKYFDKIYCINLDRRTDKWSECESEFDKWGITNVERYSAIDGNEIDRTHNNQTNVNNGNLGLLLTHIDIIKKSKVNGYSSVLLIEDDITFSEKFSDLDNYMSLVPDDWDILYFGGNHNQHMGMKLEYVNDKVIKSIDTYTTHCFAIKNTMFDLVLNLLSKHKKPVDVYYSDIQKNFNCYSFYPGLASQRPSFSDIQNKVMDNRWLIK